MTDRPRRKIKLDFWFFVKAGVILALCLFIVYPFYTILTKSVFSSKAEGVTLYNFQRFFTKKYYYRTLLRSLVICSFTTLFACVIGVFIAYVMTRYNVLGKNVLHVFIILSLMSPPFIGAYSWIVLLGRNGLVTQALSALGLPAPTIYGRNGIIFVFTLHLFPYVYLYTSGAMNSIDSSLEEAAENLGMNKLKRIMTITLPVVLPSILAGCIMVFMTCLADFGTPMLLGEGYTVLPVLVYNEYMSESATDPYMASALSVVIVACSMVMLALQKLVVEKKNYTMSTLRPPQETQLHGAKRFLASFPVYLVIFFALLPQLVPDGVGAWGYANANGPGYALLIARLGAGVSFTDWAQARPGDVAKLWWNDAIGAGERGHLVVLVQDEGEQFRFWSANMARDGQNAGYGIRRLPKSAVRRVLFTRITRPAAFNNAARLPNEPWLTELMRSDTDWSTCCALLRLQTRRN